MLKKSFFAVAFLFVTAFSTGAFAQFTTTFPTDKAVRIDALNRMSQAEYEKALSNVFERAPWIIKISASKRPFTGFVHLYTTLVDIALNASYQDKMELINSHPDLACKGVRAQVGAHSASEQGGSGLNECSQEEADYLKKMTADYRQKFGFTFMLAVNGFNRPEIMEDIKVRINNSQEREFNFALQQVTKVIMWRLLGIVK